MPTMLKNARLIDGLSDRPRDGVAILIGDDGRIASVEDTTVEAPEGCEVLDLAGRCVLPGLIDTHVHSTVMDRESLPVFLAAGVTSARDVGANLDRVLALRADLASGAQLGPRLYVCGPLLDGAQPSFSPRSPLFEILDFVPSVEDVPDKVQSILDAGVDGVKLYFTLPPETAKAIIQYVEGRVPVTGHLGYTHSMDVIEAGIDGLEHIWISPYNDFCAHDQRFGAGLEVSSMLDPKFWKMTMQGWAAADLDSDAADRWFGAMVDNQVNMGTTLDLLWVAKCGLESAMADDDRQYMAPMAFERQRAVGERQGSPPGWDVHPGFDLDLGARALDVHLEVTRRLHEAGGLLVGGTDCGAIAFPPPGFALLREVELLAEAVGAMEAIKAVTSVAARYMRVDSDIGAVAPGRYGDLLVVDGDPSRDVTDLRNLVSVYRGGVAHDPAELLAAAPPIELP
jgi:imidazolonepropionase-like amidohydrolase